MSEFHLQRELILWFKETYPQFKKCIRLSMNGINLGSGVKAAIMINQMRAQGMTKDESDLFFAVPNEDWHGLFLELKAKGKKPTSDQMDYMDEMISNGYMASWCDNLEEARNIITDYIGQKNTHSEEGSRHDGVVTEEAIR